MSSELVAIVAQFAFATVLPAIVCACCTLGIDRSQWGARIGYWPRQIIIGVVFGLVAIFGTEFGIATNDATMNVRDAAPLVAGLYFGSPAGIIAGIIGGVERWFAALWGRGMLTRVACSAATIFAGFYAAALRRYLLGDRRPSWLFALAFGMVAEDLHMLLVLFTNLHDPAPAFLVVRSCTLPMVTCNAIAVALSGVVVARLAGQRIRSRGQTPEIAQRIQAGMLVVVAAGFALTVGFVAVLQTRLAHNEAQSLLRLALQDTRDDIEDASDANLLSLAKMVAREIPSAAEANQAAIDRLVSELDLAEIHIVDSHGIIVASSDRAYVGFDMAGGKQSAEFLSLLPGGGATQLAQSYQPISMDANVWRKYAGVAIRDGFVQVSYDAARFVDDLAGEVRSSVANRHVGTGGMLVVMNERDALVGTRSNVALGEENMQRLARDSASAAAGAVFSTEIGRVRYLAMHESAESLRVIALLPAEEAETPRDMSVLTTSLMEVLIFAALFLAIYVLVERVVVRSIWQVNGRLGEITQGDLAVEVDVRDSTEFALLSDDINNTVAALRAAIAAEGARIERDLATAKAIQESALPRTFPPFPDISAFDLYASMNAAREVGGDFYDFFLVDDHTLGFLIADVSGKGIPASLFMMAAKSELANYVKSGMDLAEAVRNANWNLCRGNDAGMFVTAWVATLDYDTGLLTYVNAGHNPPLLRHEGSWRWLSDKCGLILGVFDAGKYRSRTLTLVPGDELLLYTDGVNEAFNVDEELYGDERLKAFLDHHADLHPRMLVDLLRADLRRWSKGAEQSDDITMLCLEYGQSPEVTGTVRVAAGPEGLSQLMARLHFDLAQLQCPEAVQRQLDLVIEELVTNIYKHGYDSGEGDVEISYVYDADPAAITVSVTDWGKPFDPLGYEREPDATDEAEGIGIAIALGNVDDAAYVRDGAANVVAFRKSW